MRINDTVIYTASNKIRVGRIARLGEDGKVRICPITKSSNVVVRMPEEVMLLSVFFQKYKRFINEYV